MNDDDINSAIDYLMHWCKSIKGLQFFIEWLCEYECWSCVKQYFVPKNGQYLCISLVIYNKRFLQLYYLSYEFVCPHHHHWLVLFILHVEGGDE